jgi:anthranilate/para-aminobenzoate synthase component II
VGFYVTGMRLDTQTNSAVRDLAAVKTRRYHSLIVAEKDLPDDLAVSAWTHDADGTRVIMACATASFQ